MDLLATVTGSRVRADLLAALFGGPPRSFGLRDLGRAAHQPHQLVERELRRLVGAGLVRSRLSDGKRTYEADVSAPAARELAGLIRQSRGRIPAIRTALAALRSPTLAWALPRAGRLGSTPRPRPHGIELVVLSGAPKSLVRLQLADLAGREGRIQCMSVREWIARLDKGDVDVRRARRSRKLWIIGSWDELVRREQAQLDSVQNLRAAVSNWREQLSDDWDDGWDPTPIAPRHTR